MSKKIIGLALCSLFLIAYFPVTGATDDSRSVTYTECYIVSSGTIYNRLSIGLFKIGNRAFIIYINMGYEEDGNTSIYDDDTGELLWQQQGAHSFILVFYRGNYTYIKNPDGSTFVTMDGLTIIARV